MADFVTRAALVASGGEIDELLAAAPPDLRRTAAARTKGHVVGLGRSEHESELRERLPMRDGTRHARLVRQRRVDGVRDAAARPAELGAGEDHAHCNVAGLLAPDLLGLLAHLLLGAQDDVAFEEGQAVGNDVLDGLGREGVAAYQSSEHRRAGAELAQVLVAVVPTGGNCARCGAPLSFVGGHLRSPLVAP